MAEGLKENRNRSLIRDIHIGDFVELIGDEAFFDTGKPDPERYGGYVTSLDKHVIGISPTHPNNEYYGYVGDEDSRQEQKVTMVNANHIGKYRVIL